MIVEMKKGATQEEIDGVVQKAKSLKLDVQLNMGTDKTVVALLGSNTGQLSTDIFAVLPGVESVTRIMKPYKLASREFKPEDTMVSCGGVEIGGKRIVVMAGPCAVESEEQLMEVAGAVKRVRSQHPARRCLQAAHLSLQLPGPAESRAGTAGQSQETAGHTRGYRSG